MDGFGKRVRLLRLRNGYTQSQLSQMLKISSSAIGMYERGLRQPNADLLIELSAVFSVSVDYLLGIEKIPESVEEMLKQIHDSISSAQGLTFNGVELGKTDRRKLFDALNIAANVILNEKMRSAEE